MIFFFFLGGGGGGGGGGGKGKGGYLNATLWALGSCIRLFNVFVGGLFLY